MAESLSSLADLDDFEELLVLERQERELERQERDLDQDERDQTCTSAATHQEQVREAERDASISMRARNALMNAPSLASSSCAMM